MAQEQVQQQLRMKEILRILEREYPEARCSLDYRTPFELLVATILSAQCTDERVNLVTPTLFRKYPDAGALAKARISELEKLIQSTGFFRSKAKALKETALALVRDHQGEVPRKLEELVELRGVGRKTANVVLGNCYGVPGIVVDTHVGRLSRRMGFSAAMEPEKVERDLMKVIPEAKWTESNHLFIEHGRAICTARKALCGECPIARFCPKIGVPR